MAAADNTGVPEHRHPDIPVERLGRGAFYLYRILTLTTMTRTETLKILNVLALAAMAFYLFFQKVWLLYLCVFFLIIALTDNPVGRLTAGWWMKLAEVLGNFNSRLILALVFYLLLTPMALLYRLFNGAAAGHFTADTKATLFEDIPASDFSKSSFEKPW